MPRTARASVGGICYHVINRGNGRAEVFHKDGDYAAFVDLLAAANERLPRRVLGYGLMPNTSTLCSGRGATATSAGGCSG
jgi:putative transposase